MNTTNRKGLADAPELTTVFDRHAPLHVRYAHGELICLAGSYAAGLYLVIRGVVAESPWVDAGATRVSEIVGPGDAIGLEILLPGHDGIHSVSSRAVTDVELLFLERKVFEAAIEEDPGVRWFAIRHMAERLARLQQAVLRTRMAAEHRLTLLLLDLGGKCGRRISGGRTALPPEIDSRALGDLLCVSARRIRRARVSVPTLDVDGREIVFSMDELRTTLASGDAENQTLTVSLR